MTTPGAARARRYRRRQSECLLYAVAEAPLELAEQLIEIGLLNETLGDDRKALGAALVEAAELLVEHHRAYRKLL